jgi:hypothetical protein
MNSEKQEYRKARCRLCGWEGSAMDLVEEPPSSGTAGHGTLCCPLCGSGKVELVDA